MRIFYSGLPSNLENAPEALIREKCPDVMLSYLEFRKKDGEEKANIRFRKHLRNRKKQSNAASH